MNEVLRYPRRLIEVDLPIKQISVHARREKSIRHGHISTLHIWWARRPLAACRAVLLASLWPDPADAACPPAFRARAAELLRDMRSRRGGPERDWNDPLQLRAAMLEFIADFANWDLAGDEDYLRVSRDLVAMAHSALTGTTGHRPTVVDPFAGGGAIPIEALRVGADAYASDLNPVPILLNKTVLEFVPKYGQRLADAVRDIGAEIGREVAAEIERYYPRTQDGTPIVYLWSRTVLSEAPDAAAAPVEIPLLRSMWVSKKKGRKFALRWRRDAKGGIETTTSEVEYADGTRIQVRRPSLEVFAPRSDKEVEPGTSKAGAATCPLTGFTTPVESVRTQLARRRGGAADARLVAVVVSRDGATRFYRAPVASDEAGYASARSDFLRRDVAANATGVSLLPDGHINHLRGFFNIVLYGMTTWGDLFSPRQGLALACFVNALERRVEALVRAEDPQFALAIHTCLALAVDRLAEKLSSVARWDTSRENPQGTFGRQALPMVWDFCEVNPFSGSGGDWGTALDWVVRVLDTTAAAMRRAPGTGHVERASATTHPLPDDSVAAVFTDPPYYAAVPYADLSDFFYSWLRRTLGRQYPELFRAPLSPKDEELVSLSHRAAMYRNKDGAWFEQMMGRACSEARRICQPNGVGVFVFASKDTPAWEAMLSALVQSGWVVTASWPIDTEMGSRLRARNSATLASSIHIVCRPRETVDGEINQTSVADWRDVLSELPKRIRAWLPRLAQEGVVGADAIFACIGPALEVFTRFARVEKISGEVVTLREFLEQVWAAVSREALSMLFSSADASGLEEDARLTAMWLWTLAGPATPVVAVDDDSEEPDDDDEVEPSNATSSGYSLEYDAARKIAQGLGARLDELAHVVEIKGAKARLLAVNERTAHLFGKGEGSLNANRTTKKKQMALFTELDEAAEAQGWSDTGAPKAGTTTLDRVHQAMLLFATGRSDAMKRFLVDEGVGKQSSFWKLAQSLSALYPTGSDEKRWVDGVLTRKKGLGFG